MAFPVLKFNSSGGLDTNAFSGAGPTVSVTNVNASTDVAGTTVTVDAGQDISTIATDGSHVLYLEDTTAGHRRFSRIIGTAGSGGATPTITVSEAYTGSLSGKIWACGSPRATIGNAASKLLFDNNGGPGDAMPGWTIELQSGHTETITSTFDTRRAGDITSGPIILRGAAGAATMPVLNFSNNGNAFVPRNALQWFRDFEIRNTNATKTASVAFSMGAATTTAIWGVKISHSVNKFWKAATNGTSCTSFVGCEFGYCANIGFDETNGGHLRFLSNWVHDCGSHGIALGTAGNNIQILGNIISTNGGDGINISALGATGGHVTISHNTIASNTGDGIDVNAAEAVQTALAFINNILSSNGGYGINDSTGTNVGMLANFIIMFGNAFYSNSSGDTNPSGLTCNLFSQSGVNPTFTNSAASDYSIGTPLKKLGYPVGGTTLVGKSATYSYVDPGAAQRNEDAIFGYLPVAP